MKRIKAKSGNNKNKISAEQPKVDYNKLPIIFSLERLVNGDYCFSSLTGDDKQQFAESIFRRKNLTWDELMRADRHGLGTEKIYINSVKMPKPVFITDDISAYLAIRYSGMKPMVGIRQKNIFYVLWFDHNFTLYSH